MATKKKFSIKPKHWIIMLAACAWMFMVKMCESEDFTAQNEQEQVDIEELEQMKSDSDSLLTEIIQGIKDKEQRYKNELDSLNLLAKSGELSKEEIIQLERDIKIAKDNLQEEKDRIEAMDIRDSTIYNITTKDTLIYNIIEVDSVIIIYQIDTVYINADTLFSPIGFQ